MRNSGLTTTILYVTKTTSLVLPPDILIYLSILSCLVDSSLKVDRDGSVVFTLTLGEPGRFGPFGGRLFVFTCSTMVYLVFLMSRLGTGLRIGCLVFVLIN